MKRAMRGLIGGGWAVCCLLRPGAAGAAAANYQQYLLGDRGAGMGGGVSAIAEGVEACYYNPAGLARTPNNTLSLSANLYGFQRYKNDNALSPGEGFKADSFHSVPATAGGTFRMSTNLVTGFAVFSPKATKFFQTIAFADSRHYYTLSQDHQTLWLGPTVAYRFTPRLALGASIYGVYDTMNLQQSLYWGDVGQSYAAGYTYSSLSALGVVGLQARVNERWSVGFRAQTPSASLHGDGQLLEHVMGVYDRRLARNVTYSEDIEAQNLTPAKFTLGLAREQPGSWTVSADVSCHLARNYRRLKGTDQEGRAFDVDMRREAVVDGGLGAEVVLCGRFPLRAGVFTSFSSAPDPSVDDPYSLTKTDLYGVSFSVGSRSKNSSVNLGINYLFGRGKDLGWEDTGDGVNSILVNVRETYLYFTLNTSYYF